MKRFLNDDLTFNRNCWIIVPEFIKQKKHFKLRPSPPDIPYFDSHDEKNKFDIYSYFSEDSFERFIHLHDHEISI